MPQVLCSPALLHLFGMSTHRRRERPSNWPDWFEPKRYPHFDQSVRDPEQVRWLVESPSECAKRAFLPFIRFERVARKYKKEAQADGSVVAGFVKKPRDLNYASHTDSLILRHYAKLLNDRYETIIADGGFAASVLAYRKMTEPRCNIHFANDAFQWIETNAPCVALTFDVKDFFESLDHKLLKKQWKAVLGVEELPKDHYNIFKSMTRYSWVDRDDLYKKFKITKNKLKNWHEPICSPKEFRILVRGDSSSKSLIRRKPQDKRDIGIPQGSPISALLSNIYLLPVDRKLHALSNKCGGLYLRYSDDILLVCKTDHQSELQEALETAMKNAKLRLHDGPGKRSKSKVCIAANSELACTPPLQYLGFTFDGKAVRIRSGTVAKFLRRMRKAIRREKNLAQKQAESSGDPKVRRKMLYSRFSHLGSQNFITGYASNARKVFKKNAIREQLKNHWRELHAKLEIR